MGVAIATLLCMVSSLQCFDEVVGVPLYELIISRIVVAYPALRPSA